MREKVSEIIEKVRPLLQREGGDIELVDVNEDGIVLVRLKGTCKGCPEATITIKTVIENLFAKEVPEAKKVIGI